MGSYQAQLVGGQTLIFQIPAPAYRFQVTCLGTVGSTDVFVTGDGTAPVLPSNAVVNTGSQVCVPSGIGPVSVRPPQPGSAPFAATPSAGPTGTQLPTVSLLSSGTPTVVVEW